jgi:predicted nucleotidyltransferase
MNHRINITRIKAVHNRLGPLKDQVVFVGGATVSLYADREAPDVRETDDIDILVEISSRWKYMDIEEQLRTMGFKNAQDSKFVGRYLLPGLVVDVMPTDEAILGFSNKWYAAGFKTAIDYSIDEQHTVKIFTAPYFIASKIEAFKNRGSNDGRTSNDFADIVFVLENRRSIWSDIFSAEQSLKEYLADEFFKLQRNPYIEEWIDAHSDTFSPPGSYFILREMKDFLSKPNKTN